MPLSSGFRFAIKIPWVSDGRFNGAKRHDEWKDATAYLRDRLNAQDVLVSTLPLTVLYYLGRAEYNLNLSNSDMARKGGILASDGRLIDFYSGADVVENLYELKSTLKTHPNGWLLVDRYRFITPVYVPKDIHDFLTTKMSLAFESKRKTVMIYRWSEESPISATKSVTASGHSL